jgi:sigma-54 dependent transcriptional regulator, flagellar regulatory protein
MSDPAFGVVLVSDDGAWTRAVADALHRRQIQRLVFATPDTLGEALDGKAAVIVDGRLSGPQAAMAVRDLSAAPAAIRVVLIEAEACPPDAAITAIAHWRDKRLPDDEELAKLLQAARESAATPRRAPELFRALVGESEAIRQVRSVIERVALTDAAVLITGESGTGKEVAARNVHFESRRRCAPFVALNCAAVPEDLLESELFGHAAHALPGETAARAGCFERAEGGTLFLDCVDELPKATQARLLRVLREGKTERIGSATSTRCNVRIIAATSVDLEHEIAARRFRSDLFYRLNVLPIYMPALRERLADIRPLLVELAARHKAQHGRDLRIAADAIPLLEQHSWPGNVRELANLVQRLAVLYPDAEVERMVVLRHLAAHPGRFAPRAVVDDAPPHTPPTPSSGFELPSGRVSLRSFVRDVERRLIERALREAQGVTARAAALLDMRRTTLLHKMKVLGSQLQPAMLPKGRRSMSS